MRSFWKRWRAQREIDRPIPYYYVSHMNKTERSMWVLQGWRVDYWVCPWCGERRTGESEWISMVGGWIIPPAHKCEGT